MKNNMGYIIWYEIVWKLTTMELNDGHELSAVNMSRWINVVLMLAHRLRRWHNINTTLGQCLLLTGIYPLWTQ